MNIAFDLDGVLCNFTKTFVGIVNELWPNKLPADYEPNDWWYSEFLTDKEVKEALKLFNAKENLWLQCETLPGLEQLKYYLPVFNKKNIDVYFCTARMECGGLSLMEQTKLWLLNNGLLQHYNTSLIIVKDGKDKKWVYSAIGASFSIDDKIDTVVECQAMKDHRAFLFTQRWNEADKQLPRVDSVECFCQIVLAAASKK